MNKHLTRRDRKRRKKKAACRERRYLHRIEEKMMNPPIHPDILKAVGEVMSGAIMDELRRPSALRRVLTVTPVTTKENP